MISARKACSSVLLWILAISAISSAQQQLHRLSGHLPSAIAEEHLVATGEMKPEQVLRLSLALPPSHSADMTAYLQKIYTPGDPEFHHFLSVEEFTERFGPTNAEYEAVVAYAKKNGFKVSSRMANRMVVPVTTTVAQAEAVFHLKMNVYAHPNEKRSFHAPDQEPMIGTNLPVVHIFGLSDYFLPKAMLQKVNQTAIQRQASLAGSGPSGLYLGSDMRKAYYGGTELTGKGQTLALFEIDGYSPSDVDLTFASAGEFNSVPIVRIPLEDLEGAACRLYYPCSDIEQVVDIVQAAEMAPGLDQLRVYVGANVEDILSAIASDKISKEVSISWVWKNDYQSTDETLFQEMAIQGQSVFVASGDSGSYISGDYTYPADSAYVTAVGGTDLVTSGAGGPWASETAWSQSGGGIGLDGYALPTWQKGLATSLNGGSAKLRNVPDVAMEANIDNFFCADGDCSGAVGGTSLAAPRWAAYMAMVNEQRTLAGMSPVGFFNPTLYTLAQKSSTAATLHDIKSGSNDYTNTCKSNAYCNAVKGYDLVTGWGSPNGEALIDTLAPVTGKKFDLSVSPDEITIAPGQSLTLTVKVVPYGGFTGKVNLSLSELPTGMTATWSSASTSTSTQLTLKAGASMTRTSYRLTIAGTSGALSVSTILSVGVNSPGFVVYGAPANVTLYRGDSISTPVLVEKLAGFTGTVNLAITSVLPTGVTAFWFKNSSTGNANIAFTVAPDAQLDSTFIATFFVTVTGFSGNLSASTTLSVQVEPAGMWALPDSSFIHAVRGSTVTSKLMSAPFGTPTEGVKLSISQMTSGLTAALSTNSWPKSGGTATASYTVSPTAPLGIGSSLIGTEPLSGFGMSGGTGQGIIVVEKTKPYADLRFSASYLEIPQGSQKSIVATLHKYNGYTQTQNLTFYGLSDLSVQYSAQPISSTSTLTFTAARDAGPGITRCNFLHDFLYEAIFFKILPAPYFALTTTSAVTLKAGGTTSVTATVSPQKGFSESVKLSVYSALPTGVHLVFGSNPTTGSSQMTFTADKTAVAGSYTLVLAGASSDRVVTTLVPLTISAH